MDRKTNRSQTEPAWVAAAGVVGAVGGLGFGLALGIAVGAGMSWKPEGLGSLANLLEVVVGLIAGGATAAIAYWAFRAERGRHDAEDEWRKQVALEATRRDAWSDAATLTASLVPQLGRDRGSVAVLVEYCGERSAVVERLAVEFRLKGRLRDADHWMEFTRSTTEPWATVPPGETSERQVVFTPKAPSRITIDHVIQRWRLVYSVQGQRFCLDEASVRRPLSEE